MQDDKGTKGEIKQEVIGDASVENETTPPATLQTESVPDSVNTDERYSFFCSNLCTGVEWQTTINSSR